MPQALPLSLSVPISLVKAGTMPARLGHSSPGPVPSPAEDISQQGRYELTGSGNFKPFPSAWENNKGRLRSGNSLPGSCNVICWEEEGSYEAPEIQERKRRVLCKELDRN